MSDMRRAGGYRRVVFPFVILGAVWRLLVWVVTGAIGAAREMWRHIGYQSTRRNTLGRSVASAKKEAGT